MKKTAFAANLKRILEERSLSLTKVSLATGIPVSTLCEWTGGREPKVSESLLRLTQYLNVTLDELVICVEKSEASASEPLQFSVVVNLDGRHYRVRFDRVG